MARRNRNKGRSSTYAQPTPVGNQTMSFDLYGVTVTSALYDEWKETISGRTSHYLLLTPSKIRSALKLTTADAIKITSIIVPAVQDPTNKDVYRVDFEDGQDFRVTNAMKPTKIVPSKLSPAGRWLDASSTAALVRIFGPFDVGGSAPSVFNEHVIVNVAVRQDLSAVNFT